MHRQVSIAYMDEVTIMNGSFGLEHDFFEIMINFCFTLSGHLPSWVGEHPVCPSALDQFGQVSHKIKDPLLSTS